MAAVTTILAEVEPQGVIALLEHDDVSLLATAVQVTNPNGVTATATVYHNGAFVGTFTAPATAQDVYQRFPLPGGILGTLTGSKYLVPNYSFTISVSA